MFPPQTNQRTHNMSEELSSIVEYADDLSEAEQPNPLPVGEYRGSIRQAVQKISQRDTRYGEIAFFIGADQYPADFTDGNPDGTTIFYRRVSFEENPQARYGARRFCEAIGAPLSKKLDLSEWVGMEAQVDVGHESWEGIDRAVIQRVRAA